MCAPRELVTGPERRRRVLAWAVVAVLLQVIVQAGDVLGVL